MCNLEEPQDGDEIDGLPSPSVLQDDGLTVVDAGLDFNLPFPPLLRPERPTDVFLVFDYTWYGSQTKDPFRVTYIDTKIEPRHRLMILFAGNS
jgi:phospholipase A2